MRLTAINQIGIFGISSFLFSTTLYAAQTQLPENSSAITAENKQIIANAKPAMTRLPPGSIRPDGYLLKQMELQRDGLTGHAEELYVDIGKSDWLTGENRGGQFAWERGPYYAKGLTSLAFALNDEKLKAKAKRWIDSYLASQREDGDFGPNRRNWWANMIVLWTLRDWCEATGDKRVVPFLERYFNFQRNAFAKGDTLSKDSPWAAARAGDEMDVLLWLYRKTGNIEWFNYAKVLAEQSADWTGYYHNGGRGDWNSKGYRSHIVNFMQGLKTPPLKWLLSGSEADRTAFSAALAPEGWAMKLHGRPDRTVNGTEPLSGQSPSQGTELCATSEHILSAQIALEVLGEAKIGDDIEFAAYNTLPATLYPDGKGMRYYCILNQPACINKDLKFANGTGFFCNIPGPYSGFGCCRSNFHFAWPKFAESMWMKRENGLAATAYGDCTVKTDVAVIKESGGYPFSDSVKLEIAETAQTPWPLFLRIPGWSKSTSLNVNGIPVEGKITPGTFFRISRNWKKGDVINLSFTAEVEISKWKYDSLAATRGALLYALHIKARESVFNIPSSSLVYKDHDGILLDKKLEMPMKELHAISPWNYALVAEKSGDVKFNVKGEGKNRRLSVKAVRTKHDGWGTMSAQAPGRAKDPPASPVPTSGAEGDVEEIELIPIAFTQLRITLFPWMHSIQESR